MSFFEYFALLRIMGVTGASCNTTKYITPSQMISRTCCSTDGHRYDCGINFKTETTLNIRRMGEARQNYN